MTTGRNPTMKLLPSGVPGLDTVLGGGLPEYSFNLIAGDPGSGKTTLAETLLASTNTIQRAGTIADGTTTNAFPITESDAEPVDVVAALRRLLSDRDATRPPLVTADRDTVVAVGGTP